MLDVRYRLPIVSIKSNNQLYSERAGGRADWCVIEHVDDVVVYVCQARLMCYRSQTEAAASFSSPLRPPLFIRPAINNALSPNEIVSCRIRRGDVEIVSVTDTDTARLA